jgi:hypothetical protein
MKPSAMPINVKEKTQPTRNDRFLGLRGKGLGSAMFSNSCQHGEMWQIELGDNGGVFSQQDCQKTG